MARVVYDHYSCASACYGFTTRYVFFQYLQLLDSYFNLLAFHDLVSKLN